MGVEGVGGGSLAVLEGLSEAGSGDEGVLGERSVPSGVR